MPAGRRRDCKGRRARIAAGPAHSLQRNTGAGCGGGGLDWTPEEIPRLPGPQYPESGGTGAFDVWVINRWEFQVVTDCDHPGMG